MNTSPVCGITHTYARVSLTEQEYREEPAGKTRREKEALTSVSSSVIVGVVTYCTGFLLKST